MCNPGYFSCSGAVHLGAKPQGSDAQPECTFFVPYGYTHDFTLDSANASDASELVVKAALGLYMISSAGRSARSSVSDNAMDSAIDRCVAESRGP